MKRNTFRALCAAGLVLSSLALVPRGAEAGEGEGCIGCHSGGAEALAAPDVYLRWAGETPEQDGGHGDGDNLPPLECTGTFGCHDLAGEDTHNNGILETVGSPSGNTFHLQESFLDSSSDSSWGVAEAFNRACAERCHIIYGVAMCVGEGHAAHSTVPYTPRFGYGLTPPDADGSDGERLVTLPVDSDLTTLAAGEGPDHALCISCHDPHGTGTVEPSEGGGNHMVRARWITGSDLCVRCHMDAPREPDSDGDGLTDREEQEVHHTDPGNPDTDGDGLEDGREISRAAGSGCPSPLHGDSDGDGLADGYEISAGISPCDADSDGDGIPDGDDPFPADPGGTAAFVSESLRTLSESLPGTVSPLFEKEHAMPPERQRRWLERGMLRAADAVDGGRYAHAVHGIEKIFARLGINPDAPDWSGPSEERKMIGEELHYLLVLLQYLL